MKSDYIQMYSTSNIKEHTFYHATALWIESDTHTDYITHETTFISAALYVQEASLLLYAFAATNQKTDNTLSCTSLNIILLCLSNKITHPSQQCEAIYKTTAAKLISSSVYTYLNSITT